MSRQNGGIPSGWVDIRLEELGMAPTTTVDPSKEPNKEWELWSVPSFPTGRPEVLMGAQIGSTKQRVREGDMLLSKINPRINRVWIVGKANGLEQIASGEWIVFRQTEVDPRFLMYRLREGKFREELCAEVSGVGGSLTRARPQTIKKLRISLPPLAEQRRIVAKIEALQERSRRAREALSEVGPLLEQFRQSVLAATFRGDLTADWRAAHPNVEPASELLHRIRAERRRRWEQAELAKYEAKGQKPPRNWKEKYKEPEQVYESDLPKLPAGWAWSNVDNLFEVGYGLSESLSQAPTDRFLGSTAILRIPNVTPDGRLDFADLRYYALDQDRFSKLRLLRGDVLFNWRNAPKWIGKSAVFDSDGNFVNASFLLRLRPVAEGYRRFAAAYFNFLRVTGWFLTRVNNAVNQANFNASLTKAIILPIAPLEEQQQISRLVAEATDSVADLATETERQIEELDHLDQAILAKAFRGELVPQDPSDEPASVLLEHIRAQPKRQAKAPKQTSKSHQTSKLEKKSPRLGPQQLTLAEVLRTAD